MHHGAVPSSVPAGLADGYRLRLQRSPHRRGMAPATSQDGRAVAATAGPRCRRRRRQRVVDQEAKAWPAVGPLPMAGWSIIGPAAAESLIVGVLSINASIWG